MDIDPSGNNLLQPTLFDLGEPSSGALELFPAVWAAAEALIHPDIVIRRIGMDRLEELNAARFSPLITYMLISRLGETDVQLRSRIVSALANILKLDEKGQAAPETVRQLLIAHISQMRTRRIYALLQIVESDASMEPQIVTLLNVCTYAGNHLVEILTNRKAPMSIRMKAAYLIGKVGYLDAIPALERLKTRLEARSSGQQAMPFVSSSGESNEIELLPAVQFALAVLYAP